MAPLPQHTKASSGVRWPSTHLHAMASIAVQCVALQGVARMNMNKRTTNHKGPPTLCGTNPSPSLQLRQGKKKILPLEGTTEQPYPRPHNIFLLTTLKLFENTQRDLLPKKRSLTWIPKRTPSLQQRKRALNQYFLQILLRQACKHIRKMFPSNRRTRRRTLTFFLNNN